MSFTFSAASAAGRAGRRRNPLALTTHAGENETSNAMVRTQTFVHLDRAKDESGADMKRQKFAGEICIRNLVVRALSEPLFRDGSVATKELGEWDMKGWIEFHCGMHSLGESG